MTAWDEEAAEEIKRFARSSESGDGKKVGQFYTMAKRMTTRRAASLPKLPVRNPEIRWWSFGDWSIYFRVKPPPIKVVKFGKTKTAQQRSKCEKDAQDRS